MNRTIGLSRGELDHVIARILSFCPEVTPRQLAKHLPYSKEAIERSFRRLTKAVCHV